MIESQLRISYVEPDWHPSHANTVKIEGWPFYRRFTPIFLEDRAIEISTEVTYLRWHLKNSRYEKPAESWKKIGTAVCKNRWKEIVPEKKIIRKKLGRGAGVAVPSSRKIVWKSFSCRHLIMTRITNCEIVTHELRTWGTALSRADFNPEQVFKSKSIHISHGIHLTIRIVFVRLSWQFDEKCGA